MQRGESTAGLVMAQRVTDGHSLPSLATPSLPAVTEYRVRRGLHLRDSKMMSAGSFVSKLSIDMVKTYNRLVDERPYRPHLHASKVDVSRFLTMRHY